MKICKCGIEEIQDNQDTCYFCWKEKNKKYSENILSKSFSNNIDFSDESFVENTKDFENILEDLR